MAIRAKYSTKLHGQKEAILEPDLPCMRCGRAAFIVYMADDALDVACINCEPDKFTDVTLEGSDAWD